MSHLKSEESTCYNCVNSKWAQKYEKAVFKTKPTNFGQGGVEAPEANISFQGMMKNVICSSSVPSHWEGPFTNGLQEFSTTRHAKRRGFRGPQQLVEHETLNLKESCFSIIQLKQVVFSVINHQIAPIIEAVLKSPDEWQTRLLSHLASHPIRGTRVRQRTYVTKVIEIISDFMQHELDALISTEVSKVLKEALDHQIESDVSLTGLGLISTRLPPQCFFDAYSSLTPAHTGFHPVFSPCISGALMIGASALLGGSGPVFWDSSAAEKRAVNSVVQTVFSQKELLITQAQVQLQTTLNARIELLTAQLTSEQQEEALMLNLLGLLSKHPNVPVPGTTFSPTKNTTTSPIDP